MRRSTSEPAAARVPSATGSTAGLPDQNTASGYGHLTRSGPQGGANFLQTYDQGPAGFVALPLIREGSTWEAAPRGGMVSRGGEIRASRWPAEESPAGVGAPAGQGQV